MPSLSSIKVAVREALDVGAGVTAYTTIDDLPLTGVDAGEQAFVTSTDRFYIYSGTGWYNIALINTNPSFDSGGGPDASYTLDSNGGTPTTVTLLATDPEGIPITYSAVPSDSAADLADILQLSGDSSNTFVITAKTLDSILTNGYDSAGGTFEITFRASDGINLAAAISEFTITFSSGITAYKLTASPSSYSNTIDTVLASGVGSPLGANFSLDGYHLYIAGFQNNNVRHVTLATPFDISSGTSTVDTSFGFNTHGPWISNDGTYFAIGDRSTSPHDFFLYTLSTPYDLSTKNSGTSVNTSTLWGSDVVPNMCALNEDGTKAFFSFQVNQVHFVTADLTVPWSFSNTNFTNINKVDDTSESQSLGVNIDRSGRNVFWTPWVPVTTGGNHTVHQYILSTPWEVTNGADVSSSKTTHTFQNSWSGGANATVFEGFQASSPVFGLCAYQSSQVATWPVTIEEIT